MPSPKIPAAKETFGRAFRTVRLARGKTQEDFVERSGRTHVSMLERGVNAPTLTTIEGLATELEVHPLTLAALTYSRSPTTGAVEKVLAVVMAEVAAMRVHEFAVVGERKKGRRLVDEAGKQKSAQAPP